VLQKQARVLEVPNHLQEEFPILISSSESESSLSHQLSKMMSSLRCLRSVRQRQQQQEKSHADRYTTY
jgi:hypothetical protein